MAEFSTKDTALVLVDHQDGVISRVGSIDRGELKNGAVYIAKFAQSQGMPIVVTTSMEYAPHNGEIFKELQHAMPEAYKARIKRNGVINAWSDPAFAEAVRATGMKNLVLAGVLTDVCGAPVALDAAAAGFNVKYVVNAAGSQSKLEDDTALGRLVAAGIPLTTTAWILSELVKDWSSPAGSALQQVWSGGSD